MNCTAWCLAAFTILGAFIGTQFVKVKTPLFKRFNETLSPQQKEAYLRITKMRATIFTKGILIGLILSALTCATLYRTGKVAVKHVVCLFISVTLISCYLFYQIHPKPDYMLRHLDSHEQLVAWWEIYRTFRKYNYVGMVVGILAYISIGCSLAATN